MFQKRSNAMEMSYTVNEILIISIILYVISTILNGTRTNKSKKK